MSSQHFDPSVQLMDTDASAPSNTNNADEFVLIGEPNVATNDTRLQAELIWTNRTTQHTSVPFEELTLPSRDRARLDPCTVRFAFTGTFNNGERQRAEWSIRIQLKTFFLCFDVENAGPVISFPSRVGRGKFIDITVGPEISTILPKGLSCSANIGSSLLWLAPNSRSAPSSSKFSTSLSNSMATLLPNPSPSNCTLETSVRSGTFGRSPVSWPPDWLTVKEGASTHWSQHWSRQLCLRDRSAPPPSSRFQATSLSTESSTAVPIGALAAKATMYAFTSLANARRRNVSTARNAGT
ncbi:uncharacterized protein UMAG_12225 [Mycosarcoma maydis]|uniref:Uncharacterized protein n=1 Tax=Mycosarcoma maydis TaxID=5270 RepID=A0A0D1DX35_MYCMD|nr:uncharacterized protein UMAG_12225 [Ustilago maydis 521]KIS68784.1 hypothetical protein UMAG_12225 [Ustilago maydis 521]|eukprot:XP_011389861.1 hypothetical protein UMAG_12225 [Ustilago maydis 521]